jgi:hypothetical protein
VLATPFFLLFPAAPPRLVEGLGIADTVGLTTHDTGSFLGIRFNPYAAMPSLHVGWSLLVTLAVLSLLRRPALRIAAALHPVLMALAVTATGNHLFLDMAVGGAIALAAISLARVRPEGGKAVIPSAGARNRIRGECAADGPGATKLTLYVNRRRVAAASDPPRSRSLRRVRLFVGTSEPNTDLRFDDIVARRA